MEHDSSLGNRSSVRQALRFVGVGRDARDRVHLGFRLRTSQSERLVTVVVDAGVDRPAISFPHLNGEGGESLGSPDADVAVVDRAQQMVAFLEAARLWAQARTRAGTP
jgi:hypothetical protein